MSIFAVIKRSLFITLIVLASLALGITALRIFSPLLGPPLLVLHEDRQQDASVLMLEEMRELLRFNTVQYVYRVVFPYDFMKPGISESTIWESLRNHNPRLSTVTPAARRLADLLTAIGDPRELGLSSDESMWLATWKLCRDIALPYQQPDYAFVVSTIVVEAGFDFTGTVFADPGQAAAKDLEAAFRVEVISPGNGQKGGQRAVMTLPQARLTDVRIEDRLDAQFPDLALKPGQWKQIADFISAYYETKPIQEGILDDAKANAAAFVRELLLSSGYDEAVINF